MFTPRTTKPEKGNPYYNTKANGGYSNAIVGKPTDKGCNVLANCVGYANGRFAEIIGKKEIEYQLVCNAENFIEKAKSYGLKISQKPTLGGIMVWQKGATLNGSDGAGHVAIVERIDNANQIYTSESGYNSSAFWNSTRTNNNGRWGQSSAYTFRGCIVNPAVKEEEKPKFTTGKYKLTVSKAIRTSHELTNNIVKVGKCFAAVRKNLTSTNPNNDAYYRVGTVVDITEIYVDETTRIWGKLQNCWIVLCNKDGTPQAVKM